MINYLKSILPRIQQHSKKLDDVATFAEIPWGFMDEDGHKVTYIFRRNNELLVSKQGEVVTGKWEYLPVMQSLLIEYEGRKQMYNQGFLNDTIMLLRKDGTDDIFSLGNIQLLPKLNIERYIQESLVPEIEKVLHDECGYCYKTLEDGTKIIISKANRSKDCIDIGNKVMVFNKNKNLTEVIIDGVYRLDDGHEIQIKNGRIDKCYLWKNYQTKLGQSVQIRHFYDREKFLLPITEGCLIIGDPLQVNKWIELKDNEIKFKSLSGKIMAVQTKSEETTKLIFVVVIVAIIFYIVYVTN